MRSGNSPRLVLARMKNQGLARTRFTRPEDVVAWFGAVQAQDYLGSLWAIGLRNRRATEAAVEDAEKRRAIVRTWPLRGTLHFVAADDARWITQLLAPRVIARNAARWKREMGVDARLVAGAFDVISRALEGGRQLDRTQLYTALEARKIRTGESRGLHILLWLALQGRLCLAGRVGKQQTFALLDEWIPKSRQLDGDAALAELARRYFTSHGPATIKDFLWWSGLTARDAKTAVEAAKPHLMQEKWDGVDHWSGMNGAAPRHARTSPDVRLLPAFDQYTVGYRDRSALLPTGKRMSSMGLLAPVVIVDGLVAGTWKRTVSRSATRIDITFLRKLAPAETLALQEEMQRFREFLSGAGSR